MSMHVKRVAFFAVVCLIILMSLFSALLSRAQSGLYGYVKNIEGTMGISGVNVTIENKTDGTFLWNLTDDNGYYEFPGISSGTYNVTFKKPGYITEEKKGHTFSTPHQLDVNLYEDGKGSYTVKVLDYQNDMPVESAYVCINWGTGSCPGASCVCGYTNENGTAVKEVPANQTEGPNYVHDFRVNASGYSSNNTVTSSLWEGTNVNVTVYLKGSCEVYGYVKDSYRLQPYEKISGVLIELLDQYNNTKLNFSNTYFYNATSASNGYYAIYYPSTLQGIGFSCKAYAHAKKIGYKDKYSLRDSGVSNLDVEMEGNSKVEGSVYDKYANMPLSEAVANVSAGGSVVYSVSTGSNGAFSVWVNGNEAHTLKISKVGYISYTNSTPLAGNVDYGRINLTGKGNFHGYVKDKWNASIAIGNASITITPNGDGVSYQLASNSNGHFNINVSSAFTYNFTFSKEGYKDNGTLRNEEASEGAGTDLGNVYLEGSSEVSGYVTDCYNNLQLPNNRVQGVSVSLVSTTPGFGNSYTVYTLGDGTYVLWIPSTIPTYNVTFAHADYKSKKINENDNPNVCLVGKVHLHGKVVDKDAVSEKEEIDGASIEVYGPDGKKYYQATSGTDGNFSTYVGYLSQYTNYTVNVSKAGYYGESFPGQNTGEEDNDLGIIELTGKTHVKVKVLDDFDNSPINNAEVCIKLEEDGYIDCYYKGFTDSNGVKEFDVRERDPTHRYKVFSTKYGYSADVSGPFSSPANVTVYLYAATTVYVKDKYATPAYRDVEGADVILYYNFSKSFGYSLNETIARVSATCNGSARTGLNVTMKCLDCAYPYFGWNLTNTSVDAGNVTFRRVHVGNYTLSVNGSSAGCGVDSWDVEIDRSLAGIKFLITGANVNATEAIVKVVMESPESPAKISPVKNANVSVKGKEEINCITDENGECTLSYVPGGLVTLVATHVNYTQNESNYTVSPGVLNDFTSSPIYLIPKPGNLSIFVQNEKSDALDGINVTVANSTSSLSTLTAGGGWANFTNLTGFYNITVNGSVHGYEVNFTKYFFVNPNTTTIYTVTLKPNTLLLHLKGDVSGTNVTLYNLSSGEIAKNALGEDLTNLTNSTGHVFFTRLIPSNYNLTVNATENGFEFYWKVVTISPGSNYMEINLSDTEAPRYSNDMDDSGGSVNEGDTVKISALWTDNNELDAALLYTNTSGWVVNATLNLEGNESWSNFTLNTANLGGKWVKWQVRANDTAGNWNETANHTFYVVPIFSITFEDPTPANETTWDKNWVFVNASVSKTPDTCVLEWEKEGEPVNYTMVKSGNVCYKNMTGLFNSNYTYRVYANVSSGELNISETRVVEVWAKIVLNVSVIDTEGNPAQKNTTGNTGVNVTVWNSTFSVEGETDDEGIALFSLWEGIYNISVNGTWQGYGTNKTVDFVVNNTNNKTTIVVNITQLTVNVTLSDGTPVNTNVHIYRSDNVTYAKNASGDDLMGATGPDGLITFNRVLPCHDCNVTVDGVVGTKNANSTRFNISEGQNVTVHLDPPPQGSGIETIVVTVNVSVSGYDSSELDNISVRLSNSTGESYSNKTVDGEAKITLPSGYWNVTIDGSDVGFGIAKDYNVGMGKIVANSGVTNAYGFVSLQISGSMKYFVKVEKYGYETFDDIENGSSGRVGQQDIYVYLKGKSFLKGYVYDKFFEPQPGSEFIDNASVDIYMATDCSNLAPDYLRYQAITGSGGNYSIYASNKQETSNTTQSYCIKTSASGYKSNVSGTYNFVEGTNEINVSLVGDTYINGYVKDLITAANLEGASIKIYTGEGTPRLAYTATSDANGFFFKNVSSKSEYLNYSINITRVNYYGTGGEVYPLPNTKTYYLRPGGTTLMGVNVTSEYGEGLTEQANIYWNVSSTRYPLKMEKQYCISLVNNSITCWVYDQNGYLEVNATFLGYGYNKTYVENPNQTFKIVLNATKLNFTLSDDSGNLLDNVTVKLTGSYYENTSKNGSALFVKIPVGSYNVTFSGNVTEVYFFNHTNKATVTVNESMGGKTTAFSFIFNETRAGVFVKNESNDGVKNLTVTVENETRGIYENGTNDNGFALFREIKPASNYTVKFNKTELYDLGYLPKTSTINVLAGEDENTNNTLNLMLIDVNLTVHARNETSQGIGANVTLLFNGSVAKNGYGSWLNGSLVDGMIGFSNVKPTEDYLNENYTIIIDANKSGYGIRKYPFNVTLNNTKNVLNVSLSSLKVKVRVFNESGEPVEENVTLNITLGGTTAKNALGEDLVENVTAPEEEKNFTHLFVHGKNYTVVATSNFYFENASNFTVGNESVSPSEITFYLVARRIFVFVSENGSALEEGVNVSIVNASSGGSVNGTNGSVIGPRVNVTHETSFIYIPDGEFNVTINSTLYFQPEPLYFTSTDILNGLRNVSFDLKRRELTVFLRDSSGSALEEGANVSVINKTSGALIYGLDGNPLNATNVKDNVTFTHIPDGSFYVNVKSGRYFSRNESFSTSDVYSGMKNVSVTLYERRVKVNVYDIFNSPLQNVNVEILNSTYGVAKNLTGQWLNGTANGSITFFGVGDGNFYINGSNENYTIKELKELNTSTYEGKDINLYFKRRGFGYFNISVNSTTGEKPSNAYVEVVYNGTNLTGSGYTINGLAIVGVNVSKYSDNLNVTAYTYLGSPINQTKGPFTLSEGEIKPVEFTLNFCGDGVKNLAEECDGGDFGSLSCSSYGYNSGSLSCTASCTVDASGCYNAGGGGGGGGGGGVTIPSGGVYVCTENWTCGEWSECSKEGKKTRVCRDLNDCGTTSRKPEEVMSCTYLPSFYVEKIVVEMVADTCVEKYVTIRNNGTVSVHEVSVEEKTYECCSVMPLETRGRIPPGETSSMGLKVCSKKDVKKGDYSLALKFISREVEAYGSMVVRITKDLGDVLREKISALTSELERLRKGGLRGMQENYYRNAKGKLEEALRFIETGDYESAENMVEEAKSDITMIKKVAGKVEFPWFIVYIVVGIAIAVAAGTFIYTRKMKGRKAGKMIEIKPPHVEVRVKKIGEKRKKEIIDYVENIKGKLSLIDISKLDDIEKGYYKKLSDCLNEIEEAIKREDIRAAEKLVEDAEMFLSVLENRLVAKGIVSSLR